LKTKIAIRREDKNEWERRTPLTPAQVEELLARGIRVIVQPSEIRAFSEDDYRRAGATVSEDLSGVPVVLAVKEIPKDLFEQDATYVFFAHVIKGQAYNMPMLSRLLELNCTLIDYEKVTDEQGRRLIFFGRHAGLAGMLDSLWALGRRLEAEGFQTPFASINPTHRYADLEDAKRAIREAGAEISRSGLPAELDPMVFGFAGYGNVSRGAQEIFDLLPHREVGPQELSNITAGAKQGPLFKTVFYEKHMVRPREQGHAFELQDYFDNPERYEGVFEQYLPHLTVLMNCIYWTADYPRLVTRKQLERLWSGPRPRLRVLGDVSCDVEGALECTLKCTEPDDPVFVYHVAEGKITSGVDGVGPVVLAVDNLPCELPVESSHDFGSALAPFIPAIAGADYSVPFEELDLPAPVKRAVISHRGKLAPEYTYLKEHLDRVLK